jgi:hypothetical protein
MKQKNPHHWSGVEHCCDHFVPRHLSASLRHESIVVFQQVVDISDNSSVTHLLRIKLIFHCKGPFFLGTGGNVVVPGSKFHLAVLAVAVFRFHCLFKL